MPVTRMWSPGGVNNDASKPGNWSPNGAPQPGDTLIDERPDSTIDITDNALAGNQLQIVQVPGVTLNLSHHAEANVGVYTAFVRANVTGNDTLQATLNALGAHPGGLSVVLVDHANLHGSSQVSGISSLVIGGQNARYIHNGTDKITAAGSESVDTKVVGSGTFDLTTGEYFGGTAPGRLEFGGFVGGGQTVNITAGHGSSGAVVESSLKVDHPSQFHGTVDLHDFSLTDLVGLAQANSWSYKNNILSIKTASGEVIDRLHVVSDASSTGSVHGLMVSRTAAGDVLVRPGTDFSGSLAVPTSRLAAA